MSAPVIVAREEELWRRIWAYENEPPTSGESLSDARRVFMLLTFARAARAALLAAEDAGKTDTSEEATRAERFEERFHAMATRVAGALFEILPKDAGGDLSIAAFERALEWGLDPGDGRDPVIDLAALHRWIDFARGWLTASDRRAGAGRRASERELAAWRLIACAALDVLLRRASTLGAAPLGEADLRALTLERTKLDLATGAELGPLAEAFALHELESRHLGGLRQELMDELVQEELGVEVISPRHVFLVRAP